MTYRGIEETLNHLKRRYYFDNMKSKITTYINSCDLCAKAKYERHPLRLKQEQTEKATKPFELLHVDLLFIEKSIVLTIIDKFSKFCETIILPFKNGLEILKGLRQYLARHGLPKKLLHDPGPEFENYQFLEFLKLYSIENHTTAARSSTGNSPVERLHSTLLETIKILRLKNPNSPISEILDLATLTYNNSIHSTTKLTPFEIINGIRDTTILNPSNNAITDYNLKRQEEIQMINEIILKQSDKLQAKHQKLNETKDDPPDVSGPTYIKNNRRNTKIRPVYDKVIATDQNKLTFKTDKNQKYHKGKIKLRK